MTTRTSRSNILLIMTDQLAPQFMPCYGHALVKVSSQRPVFGWILVKWVGYAPLA